MYWGEVLTTTHFINRLPLSVLGFKSHMEVFSKFYLNFTTSNNLVPRIFGCVSFVHVHAQNWGKFDLRAIRCLYGIFLY